MKSALICAGLVVMATVSEAIFDGGIISGPALLGLIGLKVLAGKSIAVGAALGSASRRRSGGRKRYGRSVFESDDAVLRASWEDIDDCAKKMVCEINAMPYAALDKEMANIHNMFAQGGTIDVAADSVEFDLAAIMGRKAGAAQCQTIYRRCPYTVEQLMQELRA